MIINEVSCQNTLEIFSRLISYGSGYVFRGQRDSNWGISRSIERPFVDYFDAKLLEDYEDAMLRRFKSIAHHYLIDQVHPDKDKKLEWVSLAQHYGLPTRLVDFTVMPFIALFFAFDGAVISNDNSVAIWVFPFTEINTKSAEEFCNKDRTQMPPTLRKKLKDDPDNFYESCIEKVRKDLFWFIEPSCLNLRLKQQGGTFLVSDDLDNLLHSQIINNPTYNHITIDKITIPSTLFFEVHNLLSKMNINNKQIYPGLEGVAKDIKIEMEYNFKEANRKNSTSL